MPSKLQIASENVMGLVLQGELSPDAVDQGKLWKPYQPVLRDFRKGADLTKLQAKYGFNLISAANNAGEAIGKNRPEIDYIWMLEDAAAKMAASEKLAKFAKLLEDGEDIDTAKLLVAVENLRQKRTDFVTMDTVDPEFDPWIPTFYPPWDEHVMGIPKYSVTIIGAPPGVGKTTLAVQLMIGMAKKGKRVAFFSLEMMLNMVAMRMFTLDSKLTKNQLKNIYATEEITPVNEVYSKAARLVAEIPDLYAIFIDFADLMIDGEQNEVVMGTIYKTLSDLAKRTQVPIILISQLSRRYEGGLPRVSHLRYSGMAEATAALIVLLINPDTLWVDQGMSKKENPLPYIPDTANVIVGKSRYGYVHGAVGAFRVKWDGGTGWGRKSLGWTPLMGA